MEQPIIDRWLDRKRVYSTPMKKEGQKEEYEYIVVDDEFNRVNYSDLIGKV